MSEGKPRLVSLLRWYADTTSSPSSIWNCTRLRHGAWGLGLGHFLPHPVVVKADPPLEVRVQPVHCRVVNLPDSIEFLPQDIQLFFVAGKQAFCVPYHSRVLPFLPQPSQLAEKPVPEAYIRAHHLIVHYLIRAAPVRLVFAWPRLVPRQYLRDTFYLSPGNPLRFTPYSCRTLPQGANT